VKNLISHQTQDRRQVSILRGTMHFVGVQFMWSTKYLYTRGTGEAWRRKENEGEIVSGCNTRAYSACTTSRGCYMFVNAAASFRWSLANRKSRKTERSRVYLSLRFIYLALYIYSIHLFGHRAIIQLFTQDFLNSSWIYYLFLPV